MKAGIFDPYLDTIGGGERYTLTLAEYLANNAWQTDIFWKDNFIKEKLGDKLNINIKRVNFVPRENNLLGRIIKERPYELLFFLSDGSIPLMLGKKNILHFQVPFKNVAGKSFWNKFKLKKVHYIVCNSFFTKRFIDEKFGVNSRVIYPPVAVSDFKPLKKENIILAVGRFSELMQAKRQDVLVNGFKRMIKNDENGLLSGWKLILAGGTEVGEDNLVRKLKVAAKGYPIEIIADPKFEDLRKLYGKAKIFWSAAGFGFGEEERPEKMEHFGITTVEAMAAGCVPIVLEKGGQREIVKDGVSGFFWKTEEELMKLTVQLVKQESLIKETAIQSIKQSKKFAKERFCREFHKLICEI